MSLPISQFIPGKTTCSYPVLLLLFLLVQVSSVQSLSRVWLFVTPWTAAHQASLSVTNSRNPPKPVSIELVMPSSHLILCRRLLLLLPIPPSIRVFSSESALRIRWPKDWNSGFNISPSSEHPGLIFRMDWSALLAVMIIFHWISKKVHLSFSVKCYGKPWMNFLANSVHLWLCSCFVDKLICAIFRLHVWLMPHICPSLTFFTQHDNL